MNGYEPGPCLSPVFTQKGILAKLKGVFIWGLAKNQDKNQIKQSLSFVPSLCTWLCEWSESLCGAHVWKVVKPTGHSNSNMEVVTTQIGYSLNFVMGVIHL